MSVLATERAAAAEPSYLVTRNGFDCLMKNVAQYFAQGQEIFVDFRICPRRPGIKDRMRARQATNFVPSRTRVVEEPVAEAPRYTDLMVLTPSLLQCIITNRNRLKSEGDTHVVLLPPQCQP